MDEELFSKMVNMLINLHAKAEVQQVTLDALLAQTTGVQRQSLASKIRQGVDALLAQGDDLPHGERTRAQIGLHAARVLRALEG